MSNIQAELENEYGFRSYIVTLDSKKYTVTFNNRNHLNEWKTSVFWFSNGRLVKTIPKELQSWCRDILRELN